MRRRDTIMDVDTPVETDDSRDHATTANSTTTGSSFEDDNLLSPTPTGRDSNQNQEKEFQNRDFNSHAPFGQMDIQNRTRRINHTSSSIYPRRHTTSNHLGIARHTDQENSDSLLPNASSQNNNNNVRNGSSSSAARAINGVRYREEDETIEQEGNPTSRLRRTESNFAVSFTPFDTSMIGNFILNKPLIRLKDIMHSDPRKNKRSGLLPCRIERIVANSNDKNSSSYQLQLNHRNRRNNAQGGSSMVNYSRLYLISIQHPEECGRLAYIMEQAGQQRNTSLWYRNLRLRDEGVVTIGTYFYVVNPLPIESYMGGGNIPLVDSRFEAIVLQRPVSITDHVIDHHIRGNESRAFDLNNCTVNLLAITPENTKCSGKHCDRQNWFSIVSKNQGCGCFHFGRVSNMVLDHDILVSHHSDSAFSEECHITNFSSLQFQSLYLTGTMPRNLKAGALTSNTVYFETLEPAAFNIVNFINNNGGFTVSGWYKRGMINDQALAPNKKNGEGGTHSTYNNNNSDDLQTSNGKISYHVCTIRPTNQDFYRNGSFLYESWNNMKFNTDCLY